MTEHPDTADVVAQLRAEIARLSTLLAENQLGEELREAFILGEASRIIAASVSHDRQLATIIETAAGVMGARAATLFLVDHSNHQLVVVSATGPSRDIMARVSVPLGHGLAGLVALSGHAMGISDAAHDPRAAQDIMRRVGYLPHSMLCAPVTRGDEVVGVLEVLDKRAAPSFGAADMTTLALFAQQASAALDHARTHQLFLELVSRVLSAAPSPHGDAPVPLDVAPGAGALLGRSPAASALSPDVGAPAPAATSNSTPSVQALTERADAFLTDIESDPLYLRSIEIARLIRRIAVHGQPELETCAVTLRAFADYLDTRINPSMPQRPS